MFVLIRAIWYLAYVCHAWQASTGDDYQIVCFEDFSACGIVEADAHVWMDDWIAPTVLDNGWSDRDTTGILNRALVAYVGRVNGIIDR